MSQKPLRTMAQDAPSRKQNPCLPVLGTSLFPGWGAEMSDSAREREKLLWSKLRSDCSVFTFFSFRWILSLLQDFILWEYGESLNFPFLTQWLPDLDKPHLDHMEDHTNCPNILDSKLDAMTRWVFSLPEVVSEFSKCEIRGKWEFSVWVDGDRNNLICQHTFPLHGQWEKRLPSCLARS